MQRLEQLPGLPSGQAELALACSVCGALLFPPADPTVASSVLFVLLVLQQLHPTVLEISSIAVSSRRSPFPHPGAVGVQAASQAVSRGNSCRVSSAAECLDHKSCQHFICSQEGAVL